MELLVLTACVALFSGVFGTPCEDLRGDWMNDLGSNMTISSADGLKMTGHYKTAVVSRPGAATITSKMTGMVLPVEDGQLIAFNVIWNRGNSLTAWVGQCSVCDGVETLHTTWILRSLERNAKWKAIRINQDTFIRNPERDHGYPTHPPLGDAVNSDFEHVFTSAHGHSLTISKVDADGTFEGVKQLTGGEQSRTVYGLYDGNQTHTAMGFAAAKSHEREITGFAGHIYNPESISKEIEAAWLTHTFTPGCQDPKKNVRFAMDTFMQA